MTRHTERPWAVSRDATPDYAPQYTVYADYPDGRGGERVATVHGPKALADLIAAAPEMLALTERLDAVLTDYVDGVTVEMCVFAEMQRDAAALLSRLEDV